MQKLSVVIITFNEEKNIGRCLESIKNVADDIVVLDSFSTDRTKAICQSFNVNFIQQAWQGYSTSKNAANSFAKHNWILSLDADEALTAPLIKRLIELKSTDSLTNCTFNRLTNYCGTWVKHSGWYPDKKFRLFDRETTKWVGDIHEDLIGPGSEVRMHINEDILHYSYYTVNDHIKQLQKFTDLAAKEFYEKGKNPALFKLWLNPIAKFISCYIINLGLLDGRAGYSIAKYSAYATYLKYYKARNLFRNA